MQALYFFWICVLSPHVVHKGKQETSVGEAHRDNEMRSDHENRETQEIMNQGRRATKQASSSP